MRDSHHGSEVREFVYLDSVAVNSLFASMYMAVPQTIREVAEEHEEKEVEAGVESGITLPSLINIGSSVSGRESEGERGLSEINKQITDQYRFSILNRALEENDEISVHNMNAGNKPSDLDEGDLVKITGRCKTDPLYPLANAIYLIVSATSSMPSGNSFISSLIRKQSDEGEFERIMDLVYNNRIGMRIQSDDLSQEFGLVLNEDSTWVDPQQEFYTESKYTILGRVQKEIPEGDVWDLLEIFRVLSSITTSSEVMDLRAELIGKLMSKIDKESEKEDSASFVPQINPDDFIIEGETTIINPIAIYW